MSTTRYAVTGEVHPRERILRSAIVAFPIFSLPLAPGLLLGIHALVVLGAVAGGIPGGVVVVFYTFWTLGWLLEGNDTEYDFDYGLGNFRPQLIGDGTIHPPAPYWPWGERQKRIRHRRRVRQLERALDIPTRDCWYADA